MDLGKLAPWNWFKKEEDEKWSILPVRRDVKSTPFSASLHDLQVEFDNLFDSLKHRVEEGWSHSSLFKTDIFKPSLDIASDGKDYSIKVELPGMDAGNISIEYENHTLKIKGEKHQEKEEKEKDYYKMERSYGAFERILNVPEDADTQNITSKYKNGVLSVTIPRKMLPKADTKHIEIKTES